MFVLLLPKKENIVPKSDDTITFYLHIFFTILVWNAVNRNIDMPTSSLSLYLVRYDVWIKGKGNGYYGINVL